MDNHVRNKNSDLQAEYIPDVPHPNCAIIASRDDQLSTCNAAHSSVETVDDSAMRTELPDLLTGGEGDDIECVICRGGVQERVDGREVNVQYRSFVQSLQQSVVRVWGVGLPES